LRLERHRESEDESDDGEITKDMGVHGIDDR
jgi:hypothetical protein